MVTFTDNHLKAQDLQRRSQVECCVATFSPAIISEKGYQIYYKNGDLHRPSLEGPAVICPAKPDCDGSACVSYYQKYYKNGDLHIPSLKGPVIIYITGDQLYYENGQQLK